MCMYLQGTVPENGKQLSINLQYGEMGDCYKALHFNPRLESSVVVFNSFKKGEWGTEERIQGMPFQQGESFEALITVTKEGYQVAVNGHQIHLFGHRMKVNRVSCLFINGDVSMETVNIIGARPGFLQGYPGLGGIVVHHQPAARERERPFHFDVSKLAVATKSFTKQDGWHTQYRKTMPFHKGGDFELVIIVNDHGFQVNVNGHMFDVFEHRLPMVRVDTLVITGDVSIRSINIMQADSDIFADGTGLGNLPMMSTEPVYKPVSSDTVPNGFETGYDPVPYSDMIRGWMTPKKTFVFRGRVAPEASRFHINFMVSSSEDIALHLNPRMCGTVVRNTRLGGSFGMEERDDFAHFKKGTYFELMVRCGNQKFQVFVNGEHLCDYTHRLMPFTQIDMLEIDGDVQLYYILY